MSDDEYRSAEHGLLNYACGLRAGDRLRLKIALTVEDHEGKPTGRRHEPGEIWTVIAGAVGEPDVVWLRQPDGDPHTWDAADIFESFEPATDD
jgi:hypothetical protein